MGTTKQDENSTTLQREVEGDHGIILGNGLSELDLSTQAEIQHQEAKRLSKLAASKDGETIDYALPIADEIPPTTSTNESVLQIEEGIPEDKLLMNSSALSHEVQRDVVQVEHKISFQSYNAGDGYTLWPLGFLGLHHFYFKRPFFGIIYLLTFGCLGVGWVIDLFRMPQLARQANTREERKRADAAAGRVLFHNPFDIVDGYVMWAPLGLFGIHYLYLKRYDKFLLYLCTFGVLGVGWVIDGFRMATLVQAENARARIKFDQKHNVIQQSNPISPV